MMIDLRDIRGFYPPSDQFPDLSSKYIEEGDVSFQMLESDNIYDAPAFYNPVMVLNRDLAILFAELYSIENEVELRVFEPLAGIGIRALRMATESSKYISEIIINDFGDISSQIAAYNIHHLKLTEKIFQFKREAKSLALELAEQRYRYHFIDLDPFGPPSGFIDSMWSLMPRRSLIAVTATDMQALCGVYPRACYRKYGGYPLRNYHTHETAARIMIATVARSAARFDRGITPIFTSSVDHYTKVFFLSTYRKGSANDTVELIGYSYTCEICGQIDYICGDAVNHICCDVSMTKAGPLWTGDLFDEKWCEAGLEHITSKNLPSERRIVKLLTEGIHSKGLPGYYNMDSLCRNLRLTQPSFKKIKLELSKRGYRCVKTRFTKNSFRSDISGKELNIIIIALVEEMNREKNS